MIGLPRLSGSGGQNGAKIMDESSLQALILAQRAMKDGLPDAAARLVGKVLERWPESLEGLHLRALCARHTGRMEAARTDLLRLLELYPSYADAHVELATLGHFAGQSSSSSRLIRALSLAPEREALWIELGIVRMGQGLADEAAAHHRRALAIDPNRAEAAYNLGNAETALGDRPSAFDAYRRAVSLRPERSLFHSNLSVAARAMEELPMARSAAIRALALTPSDAMSLGNLGTVLADLGEFEAAWRCQRVAGFAAPARAPIHANMAHLAHESEDYQEAWVLHKRAMALDPGDNRFRFNAAFTALALGQMEAGNRLYAAGVAGGTRALSARPGTTPSWEGQSFHGKRVLVIAEQGLGDEIRFASMVPDLARESAEIVMTADKRLCPLFERSFPSVTCYDRAEPLPELEVDFWVAAGDLALRFRSDRQQFPERPGFLVPDQTLVSRYHERLAALGPAPKVGIAWRSGRFVPSTMIDSVALSEWDDVFAVPGLDFVNLQYDDCEAELRAAEEQFAVKVHRWSDIDLRYDLEAAAALTASLDLVITVATSVNDMAGALGTPCWVLTRKAAGPFGSGDNPYYPNHSLIPRRVTDPARLWPEAAGARLRVKACAPGGIRAFQRLRTE